MPNSTNALQDVASVDKFLNAAATETVPLFNHLEFEFLLEYDVFAPASRGEHEFTSHQTSFAAFCTATTRMSTARVRLHENFRTALSGTTVDSTNRHPETRLTGFSPTSNTLSTMSSTDSSSRPPSVACSTPRTLSIRPTSSDSVQRRCLVELRPHSRRILLRLRLYDCLDRR